MIPYEWFIRSTLLCHTVITVFLIAPATLADMAKLLCTQEGWVSSIK